MGFAVLPLNENAWDIFYSEKDYLPGADNMMHTSTMDVLSLPSISSYGVYSKEVNICKPLYSSIPFL